MASLFAAPVVAIANEKEDVVLRREDEATERR
jgi:hypothetical protein